MTLTRIVLAATASLAALLLPPATDVADAQSSREVRRPAPAQTRAPGKPVLAVVALAEQRITVYDAAGQISQAPVSSGANEYETPAGIFSIVQKKDFHQSNLYEDGDMPFMQRITWTGIALHAGTLPGHPASHGCIRLPSAYAERLFETTEMGLRVVIVREDMTPQPISHRALFTPRPVDKRLALAMLPASRPNTGGRPPARVAYAAAENEIVPGSAQHIGLLKSLAAAKATELEIAETTERDTKQTAARRNAEASQALKSLKAAEAAQAKAEAALADAERRLTAAGATPEAARQVEAAKAKAQTRIGETQAALDAAKLQSQTKSEAAQTASAEAQAASDAKVRAAEAAAEAERNMAPVSVFVSRKAQRFYIRKANYPIYEGPITIRDADKPIGTFVFTALAPAEGGAEMRWNVVAMYADPINIPPVLPQRDARGRKNAGASPTDVAAAEAALDRISIPKEALERITEVVLPGSSLIISDEALSRETGKDTDFVVVMSGEPQGALKVRQREPRPQYEDGFWGNPYRGGYPPYGSYRSERPRPGGRYYPWW
jgi:hypothetical protein